MDNYINEKLRIEKLYNDNRAKLVENEIKMIEVNKTLENFEILKNENKELIEIAKKLSSSEHEINVLRFDNKRFIIIF